ncbi:MAG: hypothetical protein KFF50_04270 [Desulfatitalea sp.]|nr:hypothetical protein [Desulfatitalea sp.]
MDRQTETAAPGHDHDRRQQSPLLEKAYSFLDDRPCHCPLPDQATPRACTLLRTAPSISTATPLLEVYDTFDNYPELIALPVVHRDKPVGLINRHTLYELFSKPFTRDLHGRKPIRQFMVTDPIIVDKQVSLDDLAQIIINAGMQLMYNGFIFTD